MGRIAHPIGLCLTALTCLLAGPASAQEYCVACSEPGALYRCIIEGAQPGGAQSLQMLCVTTMARQGGHATCGVKRGTVFDCNGIVKRIPWSASEAPRTPGSGESLPWASQPTPAPEPAAAPPPPAPSPPLATPPAHPATAPEQPPQTVLEMAKRANEDTARQMKKAGDTMKEATKKTWDCVVSFFKKC